MAVVKLLGAQSLNEITMNLLYDLQKDEAACRAIHKFVFPHAKYWKATENHSKQSVSITSERKRFGNNKHYDIFIHYDGHIYIFISDAVEDEPYLDVNYFHLIDLIRELGYSTAPNINLSQK